jgi:L-rhamnose mutarotase
MKRLAFRMKVFPGMEEEYKRRHDAIWPELSNLLKSKWISSHSIFLDERDGSLFGVLNVENDVSMETLPQHPVMKKWWVYMQDIMETHADSSPISIPLTEVFYLP